jgi:hypothetical protein
MFIELYQWELLYKRKCVQTSFAWNKCRLQRVQLFVFMKTIVKVRQIVFLNFELVYDCSVDRLVQ